MRLIGRLRDIIGRDKPNPEEGAPVTAEGAAEVVMRWPPLRVGASDSRTKLPGRRPAVRQRMKWQDGRGSDHFADVSFGFDRAGAIREVFCLANKDGSDMQGLVHDACIVASIALQRGASIAQLAKSFGELREEGQESGRPASVMGALARLGVSIEAGIAEGRA